jgi:hypothetical protein
MSHFFLLTPRTAGFVLRLHLFRSTHAMLFAGGFALQWSPIQPGLLLGADLQGAVQLWDVQGGTTSSSGSPVRVRERLQGAYSGAYVAELVLALSKQIGLLIIYNISLQYVFHKVLPAHRGTGTCSS